MIAGTRRNKLMGDQVSQVCRWKAVYCFENMQKNFKFQAIFDRQPVQLNEDRSDVIIFVGTRDQSGSGILNSLQVYI